VIALWTAIWSLTTKLNHGSWTVRVHLTIASIGAAICAWAWWLSGLVAFAAQRSWLLQIGVAVMAVTALVALYLHLREATYYGRRVSLALACAVTLVIGAVAWTIAVGVDDGNVNRVDLGPDVRLDARRVVPNRDIADYMAEVNRLQRAAGRDARNPAQRPARRRRRLSPKSSRRQSRTLHKLCAEVTSSVATCARIVLRWAGSHAHVSTLRNTMKAQSGKIGYILLWVLGVPIPILIVVYLLRGCT
jgi:hypothetical protein